MSKADLNQLFEEIDTDRNGGIDIQEFFEFLVRHFRMGEEGDNYIRVFQSIFTMCDTETLFHKKDNLIDKKEFVRIYNAFPEKDSNLSMRGLIGTFLFNIIDENRSGKISKEMEKFTSTMDMDKEATKVFMKQLDLNGDGKIDKNEFLSWYCDNC